MIQFRIKETLSVDGVGNTTSHFYPQYKRTLFGCGWWSHFSAFVGKGRQHGACSDFHQARNYIQAKKLIALGPTYHNVD